MKIGRFVIHQNLSFAPQLKEKKPLRQLRNSDKEVTTLVLVKCSRRIERGSFKLPDPKIGIACLKRFESTV
jgi:hypothetical protein